LRHHEKWDGSGYPDGLAGKAIPESARIVALADVFDALSMQRPYKEPWPVDKILDYVRAGAGVHFDPELVCIFCNILPQLLLIQQSWAKKTINDISIAAAVS
jgi:putative two-component system response regulator